MKNTETHPFGYWITAVDRLMRAEFVTVFHDEGITRRHWRMLNRIDGTHGDRPHHGRRGPALRRLIDLGWIERTDDGWALTDSGALAKQRLGSAVDEIRARVTDALTPDDYAAMTASLEKIARGFGWEEGKPLPRRHQRRGRRERRGRRHDHGFTGGHDSGSSLGLDAHEGVGYSHSQDGHGHHGHGPGHVDDGGHRWHAHHGGADGGQGHGRQEHGDGAHGHRRQHRHDGHGTHDGHDGHDRRHDRHDRHEHGDGEHGHRHAHRHGGHDRHGGHGGHDRRRDHRPDLGNCVDHGGHRGCGHRGYGQDHGSHEDGRAPGCRHHHCGRGGRSTAGHVRNHDHP